MVALMLSVAVSCKCEATVAPLQKLPHPVDVHVVDLHTGVDGSEAFVLTVFASLWT